MIDRTHELPVVRQVQLLDLSRSSVYYLPQPIRQKLIEAIPETHRNSRYRRYKAKIG